MQYWPFLVSANRKFDYGPIICPDLLKPARIDLFRKHLDPRSYASEGQIHTAHVNDSELGALSLYYKTEFFRDPSQSDEFAYDDFGRKIYFTYGILVRFDRTDAQPDDGLNERLVDEQRSPSLAHLKRFVTSENKPTIVFCRAIGLGERPLAPPAGQPAAPTVRSTGQVARPRAADAERRAAPDSEKGVAARSYLRNPTILGVALIACVGILADVFLHRHWQYADDSIARGQEFRAMTEQYRLKIRQLEDERQIDRRRINELVAKTERLQKQLGEGSEASADQ